MSLTKCLGTDHPLCQRCLLKTMPETPGCGWITAPRIVRRGRGGCRDYVEDKRHDQPR
jgi:hypothetical protein